MYWITVGLLLLIGFLLCYLVTQRKTDNGNLPPGPWGLPILGYVPFLRPTRFVALMKLHKRYGDVFTVSIFSRKTVVISSMELIREALVEKASAFSCRPQFPFMNFLSENRGIFLTDGQRWQEHRRFALRTLRDLGMGKSRGEIIVQQEVSALHDTINLSENKPLDTMKLFMDMSTSIISLLILSERLGSDNPEYEKVMNAIVDGIQCDNDFIEMLPIHFPWMLRHPWLMKLFNKVSKRERSWTTTKQFLYNVIQKRLALDDDIGEPQDFLDVAVQHRRLLEAKGYDDHTFDDRSVIIDSFDLITAAVDTTAASLSWTCLLLALHPDIQERARAEILKRIDEDRIPRMKDQHKLNYTLAVLDEIYRFSSVVPTSLFHSTFMKTTLGGYDIPKDTIIIPFLYAVHRDSRYWKHPNDFNPSNFMDDNQYKASEYLIPFSKGSRVCLGESLVRTEIFITTLSLLQRYRISLANRESVNVDNLLLGTDGAARHVGNHRIYFKRIED